jgi:hypothetical protein
MLKILFVVGGIAVAALGGLVLVFSLGQSSVTYVLKLTLLDATGQPLPPQPIVIWDRSAGPRQLQLDEAGQLTLLTSESFGASALGPRRPDAFAVRLCFPEISPLYYWFEVKRSGLVASYQVFNDYYSYGDTQWVGDFDATSAIRRQRQPDSNGKTSQAVAPRGGMVARWQGMATLAEEGKAPDGRRHYALALTLRQSGVETIRPR